MKTIIAISGRGNLGKTAAIRTLEKHFSAKLNPVICEEPSGGDTLLIGKYREATIGFISQGDPDSCQEDWLKKCIGKECKVIVSACRTHGSTVDCINEFAEENGYEIIYTTNYYLYGSDNEMYGDVDLNIAFAEGMEKLIDKLLK